MKKLATIFLFTFNVILAVAQVGINNSNPSSFSSLDMKSSKKGVLFPRVTTTERFAIKTSCGTSCPDGLIVFDTDVQSFFYMANNKWNLLNPFVAPDLVADTTEKISLNTTIVQNVGINGSPASDKKLDVNGKVQVSNNTNLKNTLSVKNGVNVNAGNVVVSTGNVSVTTGNAISPLAVIEANNFSTDITKTNCNGAVPRGTIIIWSGSVASIPSGWALCDGTAGTGTPDLTGRFIVGHADTDNTNVASTMYSKGSQGGLEKVKLVEANLPKHNHSGTALSAGNHKHLYRGYTTPVYYTCAGSDDFWCLSRGGSGTRLYGGESAGSHSHSMALNKTGGDGEHENRPPYYALAFIMKL